MTIYWTRRRWASLIIHIAFVSVPFTLSTVSALLFWQAMFQSWWLAVPMVAVIEVLSLIGLALFILRIESPFTVLRHLLPFISIIPLARELYLLLAHNAPWIAWSLTTVATIVLVIISWQCFRTIERLFIDPVTAAREKARETATEMIRLIAQADETLAIVGEFATQHLQSRQSVTTVQPLAIESAAPALPLSKTARVRAYALENGVSESTVWRQVKDGTLKLDSEEE
jgi:hypothetical protein